MFDTKNLQSTVNYISMFDLDFDMNFKHTCLLSYLSYGDYHYAIDNLSEYFPDATEEELIKLKKFFSMEEIHINTPTLCMTVEDFDAKNIEFIITLFNDVFNTQLGVNHVGCNTSTE